MLTKCYPGVHTPNLMIPTSTPSSIYPLHIYIYIYPFRIISN